MEILQIASCKRQLLQTQLQMHKDISSACPFLLYILKYLVAN